MTSSALWPERTDNGTPANPSDDTTSRFDEDGNLWKILAPATQRSVTFGYHAWGRTPRR